MTSRRYIAGPAAAVLWLLLATLWLAYRIAAKALRRALPPILRWLIPRPSYRPIRYRRVLGWFPQRRPAAVVEPDEPCRMSPTEVAEKRGLLWQRDGGWCQECGLTLRLDVHHSADEHPEVHHLIAWSRCKYEAWANALWNLCLLCGPCNRRIGARTTWRLRRLARELRYRYQIDQPGRAA